MKKELIHYSILTLVIAGLLFFETNIFNNKKNVSKVVQISSFDKLNIDLDCNIYVSLGEEQKVVFEGPKHALDRVETQMENGVLTISAQKIGLFAELFKSKDLQTESLNVYIKLTDTAQLITPKKGNLISNETSLYIEAPSKKLLSFNQNLIYLIRIIGNQPGYIKMR